jgi:hypothetical protein
MLNVVMLSVVVPKKSVDNIDFSTVANILGRQRHPRRRIGQRAALGSTDAAPQSQGRPRDPRVSQPAAFRSRLPEHRRRLCRISPAGGHPAAAETAQAAADHSQAENASAAGNPSALPEPQPSPGGLPVPAAFFRQDGVGLELGVGGDGDDDQRPGVDVVKPFFLVSDAVAKCVCKTSGLYYKSFMIGIYDRNKSAQYYKTTMLGS